MTQDRARDSFTYGVYLRVPELLDLQSPLQEPPVHGEMLFILTQQAQELWFKQILYDLRKVIGYLADDDLPAGTRLLQRISRILHLVGEEAAILEWLPPAEFHRFRGILKAASGMESEQFRELEIACGLRDAAYLKMVGRLIDVPVALARWPISLHDALLQATRTVAPDPVDALERTYTAPETCPQLYDLAEACSDYEMRFQEWRFRHAQVVERVIGDRSPGTAGTPGSGYLGRTLNYRFFPELWEVRNRMTETLKAT